MDTESQTFLPNNENDELKKGTSKQHAPLPPRHIMLFFIVSTVILFFTCLVVLLEPAPMVLGSSSSLSVPTVTSSNNEVAAPGDDCFLMKFWKKWSPFDGKSDARVYYGTTQDDHHRMMYKRDYVLPCNYGLLVLNVGPAPTDQHYDFDIYDDAYLWSNNNNMCVLYPHWKAYQQGYQPMWNPTDPTYYSYNHVNKHEMHKISTLIHHRDGTKDIDAGIKAKGGDYVIFGRGPF